MKKEDGLNILCELNKKIENIDFSDALVKLNHAQDIIQDEIESLENGQVIWLGLGTSLEQLENKIKLRKILLQKIKAWKAVLEIKEEQ